MSYLYPVDEYLICNLFPLLMSYLQQIQLPLAVLEAQMHIHHLLH